MFLPIVAGGRVEARIKATGEFFCLFCEKDRSYQHREWRSTGTLFFMPVLKTGSGEFVLCLSCGTPFDLECLDESSTAHWNELEVDVPASAMATGVRAQFEGNPSLAEYVGITSGNDDTPTQSHSQAPESRQRRRGQTSNLSAHSAARRH